MSSTIERTTSETSVSVSLDVTAGGGAETDIRIPCGFLGHMLELFAFHGDLHLSVQAKGDTNVDAHHVTEDIAICLGRAFFEEWSSTARARYGWCALPMDGSCALVSVDLSGRGGFHFDDTFPSPRCGDFDMELIPEFWHAFAREARATIHASFVAKDNSHHMAEALFKAMAHALRQALVPSETTSTTKGVLL
jgi:imidazoleglycerol-phosphate dehydratase